MNTDMVTGSRTRIEPPGCVVGTELLTPDMAMSDTSLGKMRAWEEWELGRDKSLGEMGA